MRQFRITVNGQSYDVTVEEIQSDKVEQKKPQPEPENKQNAAPPAKPQPAPKPASTNGHAVTAPMPGAVLSVAVKAGQTVKAGEVLLILEAMKMENEINAPTGGTIKEVSVSQGTTVNTGDLLVVIE